MAVPGEDKDGGSGVGGVAAAAAGSAIGDAWTRLITGEKRGSVYLRKPGWLPNSSRLARILPTWLFHLRPSVQMAVTLLLYLFHTSVLTQNSLVLPFQLLPNDRGNFQSVGLDT